MRAIYRVVCQRSHGKNSEEERNYVPTFKDALKNVGIRLNPRTEEEKASGTAHYSIVKVSGGSKHDFTKIIKWENEEDAMRALSEWSISDNQQKIAKAVFRLHII